MRFDVEIYALGYTQKPFENKRGFVEIRRKTSYSASCHQSTTPCIWRYSSQRYPKTLGPPCVFVPAWV